MSTREHFWAWGHPKAQKDDQMVMLDGGVALVYKREEVGSTVRFCIIPLKEKMTIPQWTGYFPMGVPPHLRSGH